MRIRCIVAWLVLAVLSSTRLSAQDGGNSASSWFQRVDATQSLQPRWPVPLVTEAPRIEECYRADVRLQPDGSIAESLGDGKGLSIIPADGFEIAFAPPSYQHHKQAALRDGFTDASFLVKYRFFSRNDKQGSLVFSVLLKTFLPTGTTPNGAGHAIFAPMFLYGKGWGTAKAGGALFNVQGNVAIALPTSVGGRAFVANDAFQVHVTRLLWPEVEISSTTFKDGPNQGKTQVFVTPGLLIGRIPLSRRADRPMGAESIAFGGGVQIAVSSFHTYNHAVVLSARLLF